MRVAEKTLIDLGWKQLLAALGERTHTSRGAEAARALDFAASPAEAELRSRQIAQARAIRTADERMPWGAIEEVRPAADRLAKGGALDEADLRAIAGTLRGGAVLRRFLMARGEGIPDLALLVEPVAELSHVSGPIEDSFDASGKLADHASAALGPLRRRVAQLHAELDRSVRDLLEDPAIAPLLQDKFYTQRDERYVLPIKVSARGRVPGIVHGSSQSGQTVFVEPERVVDLNNALKLAELEVTEEERRILAELSAEVREVLPALLVNLDILERLDWIDAAAALAEDLSATPVERSTAGAVALHDVRHPLMVLSARPCVPVDLELGNGHALILSGPNAGGKTVALKTLALAALAARAGLPVPAERAALPLFDELLCDIGDDQSLERNLSTFSAHLLHLANFLERARPGVLVLLDEVAVGTDPEQGAALAQAVLEALTQRGATVLATTHYDRLKVLASENDRFANASVGFDLERLEPTFELHLGTPGSSGALVVAKRLGLPAAVLARAEALLGPKATGIEQLLVTLADERRKLEQERAALAGARREAEAAAEAARAQAQKLAAETRKLHVQSYDDAVEALRGARAELDRLRTAKRRVPNPQATVRQVAETIARHAPAREVGGAPATEEQLVAGTAVLVGPLGGQGVVLGPPSRGSVLVQMGPLKTSVRIADVRLSEGRKAVTRPKAHVQVAPRAEASASAASGLRLPDNTLDLRGERVDDAVARLDKFLDEALGRGVDVAFVLHGHGTGALRAAVREHLARHPAVTRFRSADPEHGGDAVTHVELG